MRCQQLRQAVDLAEERQTRSGGLLEALEQISTG